MQLGASLSGTQNGGCFPSIIPDSKEEFSDTFGEGALPLFASSSKSKKMYD